MNPENMPIERKDHILYDFLDMKCLEQTNPSVQSLSSCSTLCDPMDCSTPGLPVHHQLRELTQAHVHRVGDAKQIHRDRK